MKKIFAILFSALIITVLAAGCSCGGESGKGSDKKSSAVSETTKVIETTAEGGTVEKDSDGNKITKDKDGGIISVEDKNGNALDIDEYIASHPDAKKSASTDKKSSNTSKTSSNTKSSNTKSSSSSNSSGKSSGNTKSSASSKSSDKSKSSSSSKSVSKNSDAKEEVPTVIVTIPDNADETELDFD